MRFFGTVDRITRAFWTTTEARIMTARYPQAAPTQEQRTSIDRARSHRRAGARYRGIPRARARCSIPRSSRARCWSRRIYPQAFPHLLMSARCRTRPVRPRTGSGVTRQPRATGVSHRPSATTPTRSWPDRVLEDPIVLTARGRCFRAERETAPGMRQIEFEMREIVLLGPTGLDRRVRGDGAGSRLRRLAVQMGLSATGRPPRTPSFFLPRPARR